MKDPRPDTSHLWVREENSPLSYIDWSDMTHDEWSDLRWAIGMIGGSDVGGICGMVKSDYFDINVLLLDKIGYERKTFRPTTLTEGGHDLEPILADRWYRYYEEGDSDMSDQDKMLYNRKNNIVRNEIQELTAIVRNDNYPWMAANVDRLITQHRQRPDTGVLEVKSTSTQYAGQFIASIPPAHIFQGTAYCMALNLDYFEIIHLLDNFRQVQVTFFERDSRIEDIIVNECGEFWRRVEKGREIYLEAKNNNQALLGIEELFYDSASKLFAQFLTDKQKEREELAEIDGTDEVRQIIEQILVHKEAEDAAKERTAILRNTLRRHFHHKGVRKMRWEDGLSVSFHKKLSIYQPK